MHEVNHKAVQMEKVLSALSKNALQMLERSVEDALQSGKSVPNGKLMQQTIRRLLGEAAGILENRLSLEAPLRRAILSPLQPFLIPLPHKVPSPGRIDVSSTDALWSYMSRELLTDEFSEAVTTLEDLCKQQDLPATHDTIQKAVHAAAEGLRLRLVSAGQKVIKASEEDSRARAKLRRKLGGHANLDYFQDAILILNRAPAWEKVMALTPPFAADLLTLCESDDLKDMRTHIEDHQNEINHIAALAYARLNEAPGELIKLAQALASVPQLEQLVSTPYAGLVDFALSAIEQSLAIVESWQAHEDALIGLPEATNASLLNFEELSELEGFEACDAWFQRATELKKRLAELLKDEIRSLPTLLEEAIASQATSDELRLHYPDHADNSQFSYHKCLRGLKLVKLAAQYADVLGLNELQASTKEHVERFIDRNSEKLLTAVNSERNMADHVQKHDETSRNLSRLISMSEISLHPEDTANLIRRQKTYLQSAA